MDDIEAFIINHNNASDEEEDIDHADIFTLTNYVDYIIEDFEVPHSVYEYLDIPKMITHLYKGGCFAKYVIHKTESGYEVIEPDMPVWADMCKHLVEETNHTYYFAMTGNN